MKMNKLRLNKKIWIILCFYFLLLACMRGVLIHFWQTHFLYGTKIEGVQCSFLNVEQAIEKINLEKGEENISFSFISSNTYSVSLKELGFRVDEEKINQIFKQQHLNPEEAREYSLDSFLSADSEKLRDFLRQIPELQEENMIEPQNAYMVFNENDAKFSIHEDTSGNAINFEEAMELALEEIRNDRNVIDFSPITDVVAEILTEDLVKERDELNSILKSSINFELSDGSIVTLDSNTIKNWVNKDENGKFSIDLENGVVIFVDNLANQVNEANSFLKFKPTDFDEFITIELPMELRPQLDKEREIAEINNLLRGDNGSISVKPIYDRNLIQENLPNYIELDISRQHVWMYKENKLVADTPCVTGNVSSGYDTPTGVFWMLNKDPVAILEGYNNDGSKYSASVEDWVRFYKGYGFHNAKWRTQFGGNIYLTGGSHGCVNLPDDGAAILYEIIDITFIIIIYQSE